MIAASSSHSMPPTAQASTTPTSSSASTTTTATGSTVTTPGFPNGIPSSMAADPFTTAVSSAFSTFLKMQSKVLTFSILFASEIALITRNRSTGLRIGITAHPPIPGMPTQAPLSAALIPVPSPFPSPAIPFLPQGAHPSTPTCLRSATSRSLPLERSRPTPTTPSQQVSQPF